MVIFIYNINISVWIQHGHLANTIFALDCSMCYKEVKVFDKELRCPNIKGEYNNTNNTYHELIIGDSNAKPLRIWIKTVSSH